MQGNAYIYDIKRNYISKHRNCALDSNPERYKKFPTGYHWYDLGTNVGVTIVTTVHKVPVYQIKVVSQLRATCPFCLTTTALQKSLQRVSSHHIIIFFLPRRKKLYNQLIVAINEWMNNGRERWIVFIFRSKMFVKGVYILDVDFFASGDAFAKDGQTPRDQVAPYRSKRKPND